MNILIINFLKLVFHISIEIFTQEILVCFFMEHEYLVEINFKPDNCLISKAIIANEKIG